MPRPNRSEQRRDELLPAVAAVFAELGYRRATTAEIAARCDVQETILYRLWPDKRAMFIAAIEFVASNSERIWNQQLAARGRGDSSAERLLAYESSHLGEFGFYRILLAGWSETDDPEIAASLRAVYRRFVRFIGDRVAEHRAGKRGDGSPALDLTAWALLGVGTAANLGRELGLLSDRARQRLLRDIGGRLLGM